MPVERNPWRYYPTPQAAGTSRLYGAEAHDCMRFTLAAGVPATWANPQPLEPGLWVVRVISGYQTSCEIMIAPREVTVNPATGIPASVTGLTFPRSFICDPVYSAVAEAAGRASVLEIDVDGRGVQLWARCVGNDDCRIEVTRIAHRAEGWGGMDNES